MTYDERAPTALDADETEMEPGPGLVLSECKKFAIDMFSNFGRDEFGDTIQEVSRRRLERGKVIRETSRCSSHTFVEELASMRRHELFNNLEWLQNDG